MADKPYEYDRRPRKREKKPTKYALSLVGESGEFNMPEGYESLDGMELVIEQALPGDNYLVVLRSSNAGWRRGDRFIVKSHEFITTEAKKRSAT